MRVYAPIIAPRFAAGPSGPAWRSEPWAPDSEPAHLPERGAHLRWWGTLHLLNLALFALAGLAVYLLLEDVHNFAATASRVAISVFIPLYAAFDALAGIGTGLLAQLNHQLPAAQAAVVEPLIDRYWSSPTIYALAVAGSIAWVIALLAAAVALTSAERRRLAAIAAVLVFLVGGGPGATCSLPLME